VNSRLWFFSMLLDGSKSHLRSYHLTYRHTGWNGPANVGDWATT